MRLTIHETAAIKETTMTFAEIAEIISNMSREQQNKEAVFSCSESGDIDPIKDLLPSKDAFMYEPTPRSFYKDPNQWVFTDFNVKDLHKQT
jgi:hypothetical protein